MHDTSFDHRRIRPPHRSSSPGLGLALLTALLLAGPLRAEPPRYEIEFLDRAAIEAPSDALPLGGTVDGQLAISPNGRWLAGQVRDNADAITPVAYRIDRYTGTIEILDALRGIWIPQVNDAGHVATRSLVDPEVLFWSEETGVVAFGAPSWPAYSVRSLAYNRFFNDQDVILVRPLPLDVGSPTGATLWSPLLGTLTPLPYGAMAVDDAGLVVGQLEEAGVSSGFGWEADGGSALLPNPEGRWMAALGVGEAGGIVGETRDGSNDPPSAVLWPDRSSPPIALPCPEHAPGFPTDCAALHVDQAGTVYGGADIDDGEPLTPVLWDGTEPRLLNELLVDPGARCGYFQVSDFGELAGSCVRFDPDDPAVVLEAGPAILHPVHPGLTLTVVSPLPDSLVTEGPVVVEGTASDDGQILMVTVNDVETELVPTGNPDAPMEVAFALPLLLCPGPQPIVVVATDDDGNSIVAAFAVDVVPGETSCDGGGQVLDCSFAVASPDTLWPPNHAMETISIAGVATADGSEPSLQITGVRQDEPVDGGGDGETAPDALVGAGDLQVRRERSGRGDGRIYEIEFEATDGVSSCTGSVTVGVPHDQGRGSTPLDSGFRYDSTLPRS